MLFPHDSSSQSICHPSNSQNGEIAVACVIPNDATELWPRHIKANPWLAHSLYHCGNEPSSGRDNVDPAPPTALASRRRF